MYNAPQTSFTSQLFTLEFLQLFKKVAEKIFSFNFGYNSPFGMNRYGSVALSSKPKRHGPELS